MKPPTLKELLTDPIYKKYFVTQPFIPESATIFDNPWHVYAQQYDGKWLGKALSNYARCVTMVKTLYSARDDIRDVTVVSKRVMFSPPPGFNWLTHSEWATDGWCGRCRRPTLFKAEHGMHALRHAIVVDTKAPRCYFCGMGRDGMISYEPVPIKRNP